jgi:hypothetical protein
MRKWPNKDLHSSPILKVIFLLSEECSEDKESQYYGLIIRLVNGLAWSAQLDSLQLVQ